MKNYPWVIKENKSGRARASDPERPRFMIDYNRKRAYAQSSTPQNSEISRQIISLLKQNADLVIKFDSSLPDLPEKQREGIVLNFIEGLKLSGLEYRYRRYPGPGSANLWSQLFSFRKDELRHEISVYVPDQAWRQNDPFLSPLAYGVFYYVCNHPGQSAALLDGLVDGQITGKVRFDLFKLIIFDWTKFGQMGLFTDALTLKDLRTLLEII